MDRCFDSMQAAVATKLVAAASFRELYQSFPSLVTVVVMGLRKHRMDFDRVVSEAS